MMTQLRPFLPLIRTAMLTGASLLLVGLVVFLVLGPQGKINSNRPFWLIQDMDFQPKYGAQQSSDFFADGRTMRPAPAGTIAMAGGRNNAYFADAGYLHSPEAGVDTLIEEGVLPPKSDPDLVQIDPAYYAGKKANGDWVEKIPIPVTGELMARGMQRYEINCNVCHGPTGAGNGITTLYGMVGVASYHQDRLREMADGEIYNTIAHGKGIMMGYGHQIKVEDRWAIVAYVRALQRRQSPEPGDQPSAPSMSTATEVARR